MNINLPVLIFLIMFIMKIAGATAISWAWVLCPLWIPIAAWLSVVMIIWALE
jgi:hypothetical protein